MSSTPTYGADNSLIDGVDGSRRAKLDNLAKVLLVMPHSHHEIHEGHRYFVSISNSSMGINDTLVVAFKTGSAPKRMHVKFSFNALAAVHLDILEGPTWTQGTGTLVSLVNRRRDSANSSFLLEDQGQPTFTASDKIIKDPTITDSGTILPDGRSFGTKHGGGGDFAADEFIFKPDTQYAIKITADIGSNGAQLEIDHYEHIDV
jgi:hypothetical protein